MTTQKEHFAYIPEVTWGTYLAPTKAYTIRKGTLAPKRTYEYPDESGAGRSNAGSYLQELAVTGSIEASLRPEYFLSLLAAQFRAVVSTIQGAGPAYRHKLLPDDSLELGSYSCQFARANGVTQAVRGLTPTNFKIMAEAKQTARWSMDFVAKDAAVVNASGQTTRKWADGSTAPEAVVFDSLYTASPRQEPLKFFQGSVLFGGTKALTSGEIVVTGGAAQAGVRRCELTVEYGTETDDFDVITDPTIQSAQAAKRKITAAIDIDQKVAAATFLDAHMAATDQVLVLDFAGPIIASTYPWLFRVVLPVLKVTDAPLADVDGGQGLKRVTLELTAYADASLTGFPDIGLVLQSKDTAP